MTWLCHDTPAWSHISLITLCFCVPNISNGQFFFCLVMLQDQCVHAARGESLSKSYMQTSTARNHSINFTATRWHWELKSDWITFPLKKKIAIFLDDQPSPPSRCGQGVNFVNNRVWTKLDECLDVLTIWGEHCNYPECLSPRLNADLLLHSGDVF